MTLTIIAGTHSFIDLTGKFRNAFSRSMQTKLQYEIDGLSFSKRRFDRVEIQKDGRIQHLPSRIFPMDRNGFAWSVSQPTGSGKTILAVYNLRETYRRGGNIQANLSYQHMKHNEGKPREEWTPSINSMEDLEHAKKCHLVIDDVKGTIETWQAKEAQIISMVANLGRKEGVDLDFTTQRVINFMPPNIRAVATGYLIPYITIRDLRINTPDNNGYPREMEVLALIPADMGDVFVGFGVLHGDVPDGKIITPSLELLNSYKTMEIAVGLKHGEDGIRTNQPGYELEAKALDYLQSNSTDEWVHLNGKAEFDIVSNKIAIDVVGMSDAGQLHLDHKNLMKHIKIAKIKNQMPYLMYIYGQTWRFIRINRNLNDMVEGKKINYMHLIKRQRTLEAILDDAELSVIDISSIRT